MGTNRKAVKTIIARTGEGVGTGAVETAAEQTPCLLTNTHTRGNKHGYPWFNRSYTSVC